MIGDEDHEEDEDAEADVVDSVGDFRIHRRAFNFFNY